ncbi:hypothetical protein P5G62_011235 [Neobacillus sp. 179-C4.2 HS]|uniref:Uncharacterized protein n=1 Tax=Neobacillus driksii TaxID=3035913 RepID=A0ABV4YV01_9BACI|nr:hypothetical protein [Neobacillus sp. 179.-C4.2 HS]
MGKVILILLLLINISYLVSFLAFFGASLLNNLWLGTFIGSLILSFYYLMRTRKQKDYTPYLSIAVISFSMGSLGLYVFIYYLSNLLG